MMKVLLTQKVAEVRRNPKRRLPAA
jgi:hypothetical protein